MGPRTPQTRATHAEGSAPGWFTARAARMQPAAGLTTTAELASVMRPSLADTELEGTGSDLAALAAEGTVAKEPAGRKARPAEPSDH